MQLLNQVSMMLTPHIIATAPNWRSICLNMIFHSNARTNKSSELATSQNDIPWWFCKCVKRRHVSSRPINSVQRHYKGLFKVPARLPINSVQRHYKGLFKVPARLAPWDARSPSQTFTVDPWHPRCKCSKKTCTTVTRNSLAHTAG
jgi:hypothetical protein